MNWNYVLEKVLTAFYYFLIVYSAYAIPKFLLPIVRRDKAAKADTREKVWMYIAWFFIDAAIAFIVPNLNTANHFNLTPSVALFSVVILPCIFGLIKGFDIDNNLTDEERTKQNKIFK